MKNFITVLSLLLVLTLPALSQLQSDSSDAVWSIVMPQTASHDIDMKQVLLSESKDSVVSGFIKNTGTWKFRVDSIYFRGGDAAAFSLVSGFPVYEVMAGVHKAAEFRFKPSKIGLHTSEIVIVTQAETIIQNIRGEGVEPQLAVAADILDFGEVEIGNDKIISDTVLLRNISGSPITITNTVKMSPDIEQFNIISGGGGFTLPGHTERKLSVQFKPKYGGRTSGRIGFEYDGVGSPAVAHLFGTGIGGVVSIPYDSGYAGDRKDIPLILEKINPEGIKAIASSFSATVKFNGTILAPQDFSKVSSFINDSIKVNVQGEIPNSNTMITLPVIVGLGSVEETSIEISDFTFYDASGNKIEYDVEYRYGNFKLLGICPEGGKRLLNPSSQTSLMNISPNPAESKIDLEFSLTENGYTEIAVYNVIGEKVKVIFGEDVNNYNIRQISADISEISTGQYIIIFKTPTYFQSEKLTIIK